MEHCVGGGGEDGRRRGGRGRDGREMRRKVCEVRSGGTEVEPAVVGGGEAAGEAKQEERSRPACGAFEPFRSQQLSFAHFLASYHTVGTVQFNASKTFALIFPFSKT